MSEVLLRSLIWTDFRVAVLFAVILPLILLVWAFVQQMEAIQRLMIIYWRVSSLLMITVYLLIGNLPISFIAALIARLLIPLSLWFWLDLNEEIDDQPANPFKLAFTSWRWSMTVYSLLGAIIQLFFLPCALSNEKFTSAFCQAWRQPPLLYQQYFHSGYGEGLLGFAGIFGLVIYMLYLGYFVVVRLGRQGRSAIQP